MLASKRLMLASKRLMLASKTLKLSGKKLMLSGKKLMLSGKNFPKRSGLSKAWPSTCRHSTRKNLSVLPVTEKRRKKNNSRRNGQPGWDV